MTTTLEPLRCGAGDKCTHGFVEMPEGKSPFEDLDVDGKILQWILYGMEGVDRVNRAQDRDK
jgi:hypothetical protein